MRSKTIFPALTALLLVFALTGCGSSGDSKSNDQAKALTQAELVAQGDKLCKTLETKASAMDSAETPEEISKALGQVVKSYEETLDQLEDLVPPANLSATYATWLEENDEMIDIFEDLQKAAKDNDNAAAAKLEPKMSAQIKKLDKLAAEIGFKECTRQ